MSTETEDNLNGKQEMSRLRPRAPVNVRPTEIAEHEPAYGVQFVLHLIVVKMFVDFRKHFLHDFFELRLKTEELREARTEEAVHRPTRASHQLTECPERLLFGQVKQ